MVSPARCTTRPPNIPNALARFYGLHHGSVVRYQCFPGFELDTNRTETLLRKVVRNGGLTNTWPLTHDRYSVKCEYGVWKGEPPTCVHGEKYSFYRNYGQIGTVILENVKMLHYLIFEKQLHTEICQIV